MTSNQKGGRMNIKKILMVSSVLMCGKIFAGYAEESEFIKFTDRLSLRVIQNQTINSSFKVFYSNSDCLGFITPQSVLTLQPSEMLLQEDEKLCLLCVKGSFLPIYIKDEGRVSGQVPVGFHGPYYLSMWLEYPDVSDEKKIHVRYMVENNKQGEIGIRIDPLGNCQILALSNITLLPLTDVMQNSKPVVSHNKPAISNSAAGA